MVVSEIQLFEVLAQELGREKAKHLVEFVEAKIEKRLDEKTNVFSTKEDLLKLQVEIEKRFNQLTVWVVATGIALAGVVIAVAKL